MLSHAFDFDSSCGRPIPSTLCGWRAAGLQRISAAQGPDRMPSETVQRPVVVTRALAPELIAFPCLAGPTVTSSDAGPMSAGSPTDAPEDPPSLHAIVRPTHDDRDRDGQRGHRLVGRGQSDGDLTDGRLDDPEQSGTSRWGRRRSRQPRGATAGSVTADGHRRSLSRTPRTGGPGRWPPGPVPGAAVVIRRGFRQPPRRRAPWPARRRYIYWVFQFLLLVKADITLISRRGRPLCAEHHR